MKYTWLNSPKVSRIFSLDVHPVLACRASLPIRHLSHPAYILCIRSFWFWKIGPDLGKTLGFTSITSYLILLIWARCTKVSHIDNSIFLLIWRRFKNTKGGVGTLGRPHRFWEIVILVYLPYKGVRLQYPSTQVSRPHVQGEIRNWQLYAFWKVGPKIVILYRYLPGLTTCTALRTSGCQTRGWSICNPGPFLVPLLYSKTN